MKTIGIMGAMKIEIAKLREAFQISAERQIAGFVFYSGSYEGVPVVLTTCGVGKVNAACCTQILIDHFAVTAVINTGIAGSMHDEVHFGDVVISDQLTYHDVRPQQMQRLFPFKEHFTASASLVDLAKRSGESVLAKEYKCHVGKIVTGEQFVTEQALKQRIADAYHPLCVEMEGAAIAHVAEINEVPFVVIRSISDHADENAEVDYNVFEALAANQSANLVLKMLEKMQRDNPRKEE